MLFISRKLGLGELITTVTEICGKYPHNLMWFRGHEEAGWKLQSRIRRDYTLVQERSFAAAFMLEAPIRYENAPKPNEFPRWLPLMQHYRLPTRLLDWTKSPLIAAYFALSHNRDSDSAIWGLFPLRLNEIETGIANVFPLAHHSLIPFVQSAFNQKDNPKGVRAVMAETIDIRMLVQQAMFTIHGDCGPLEEEHDHTEEVLVKFILPQKNHDRMYAELDHSGVTRAHLFPDLENLAISLCSRWRGN